MPFYRFHIDVHSPTQVVTERLRSVHKTPREQGSFPGSHWREFAMPFVGYVKEDSFTLRRNIRYRSNSFLPVIRSRIVPTETGAQVKVTMFMNPWTAIFMAFWLGFVGWGALTDQSASPSILWLMFVFGLALSLGGFFPEAIKARRLLIEAVLEPEAPSPVS